MNIASMLGGVLIGVAIGALAERSFDLVFHAEQTAARAYDRARTWWRSRKAH